MQGEQRLDYSKLNYVIKPKNKKKGEKVKK